MIQGLQDLRQQLQAFDEAHGNNGNRTIKRLIIRFPENVRLESDVLAANNGMAANEVRLQGLNMPEQPRLRFMVADANTVRFDTRVREGVDIEWFERPLRD